MQGRKIFEDERELRFSLSAHVPAHNFYRRLKAKLDLSFLYELTATYYGSCGQQSIDPVVFFKLCLVGHLENIISDRRLIEHCSLRLDLLYFLDYQLDEPLPWHSTLSRTRQLLPESLFEEVFTRVLSLCVEAGMVAGHTQVVDSALIKANASMDSLELKVPRQELADHLERVRAMSPADRKAMRNKASQQQRTITASRDELQEIRIAVKPGKARKLCHLLQLSVDSGNHVITHAQADHADKKDSLCLPALLGALTPRLQQLSIPCTTLLADAGYSSGENYALLEQQGITAFIPPHGTYKGGPAGFTYEREGDYWRCPQNKKVTFRNVLVEKKNNNKKKTYYTTRKDCRDCPIKESCIGHLHVKKIEVTYYRDEYERVIARLNGRWGRRMKRVRQATVEPVLGTLLNFMGMRKVNTRGLKLAHKRMLLAATAYNLQKWQRYNRRRSQAAVVALPRPEPRLLFVLIFGQTGAARCREKIKV